MKSWTALLLFVPVCAGCTMNSLTRQSVAQSDSAVDVRYQEIMDDLAKVADDPWSLPDYASIFSGTIFVQDQGQIASTTIWPMSAAELIGGQITNPSINRQISQNWTLDPIMVPEKLEAIRAACQWVLYGPGFLSPESMSLLERPQDAPRGPDRHFGVKESLQNLEKEAPGWLHWGPVTNVPHCACYKAHCCHTWVWVMPDGMNGLSRFMLLVQNIARIQINSPTLFNPPLYYTPVTFLTAEGEPTRPGIRVTAQVVVDQSGRLQTDLPYLPIRIETTGVDSAIRSAISAAGISSVPH
jgi:hypothetical protein